MYISKELKVDCGVNSFVWVFPLPCLLTSFPIQSVYFLKGSKLMRNTLMFPPAGC